MSAGYGPIFAVMTHAKIGDFLLLTPYLRVIAATKASFTVVVPDVLYPLFREQSVFSRMMPAREFAPPVDAMVLDLTYPLLEGVRVPSTYLRLDPEPFRRPRHVTAAYREALAEHFGALDWPNEPAPYLDLAPDPATLGRYGAQPFRYFTVHSGSDHAPKNWDPQNFERTAAELLKRHPDLRCLALVGPCDEPLFQERPAPENFQNVSTSFRDMAHLLAGSLLHVDNDSGVHHLAGVLDVPTISVWGPTGPGTWSSLSKRNFLHWGGPSCAAHCAGARMNTCEDRVCLEAVQPAEVLRTTQRILSAYGL